MQVCLIIVLFLMLGLCLFILALQAVERMVKRKISLKSILNEWGKKMAMVAGIGPVFFGFYFLIVYLGTFVSTETRLDTFFLLYKQPVPFIYLGLFVFASVSIGIYCVRLVIKYVCNSTSRN